MIVLGIEQRLSLCGATVTSVGILPKRVISDSRDDEELGCIALRCASLTQCDNGVVDALGIEAVMKWL